MKRALIAFILSALTFFGGHYYNKHWVRATFFSTLLFLWFLLFPSLFFLIVMLTGPFVFEFEIDVQHIQHPVGILGRVWTIGLGLIWLSSAITSALDARHPSSDTAAKGTFTKWFSILGMCAIGLLVVISIPAAWFLRGKTEVLHSPMDATSKPKELITKAPPLIERKQYLGSGASSFAKFNWDSQKVLTKGPGIIKGKVMVNDKPCSGLKIRLFLSDELRSQWGTSDKNGLYEIEVPFGKYRYQGWDLDDESADKVLAGKIKAEDYSHGDCIIAVTEDMPGDGPDFYFIDPVVLLRPLGSIVLSEKLIFEWEPYPEAVFYEIQITDCGAGKGPSYKSYKWDSLFEWGDRPRVKDTRIAFSELGVSLKKDHLYNWQVEAYNQDDRIISRTPHSQGNFRVK